jgi:hypothetical protein
MNYDGTRMLVDDALSAGHDYDRHDAQHCAQHVHALRAVRLETNRGLDWGRRLMCSFCGANVPVVQRRCHSCMATFDVCAACNANVQPCNR